MTNRQEMMNYYDELWGKIERKENPADFWDQKAGNFNQKSTTKKNRLTDTMDFLLEKGLEKTDDVLDIGCATGKLAIQMSPHVASVLGTDISPKMIQYAKENASEEKLDCLRFELSTWSDIDIEERGWTGAFDWVVASMTPAIQDIESLKKMIQASKKHCFVSTIVNRENQLDQDLRKRFSFVQGKTDFTNATRCIFNLLWLMDYTPEVRYVDTSYTNVMTVDEIMRVFALDQLDDKQQNQARAYLKEISIDGGVVESVSTKVSFIYWQVS